MRPTLHLRRAGPLHELVLDAATTRPRVVFQSTVEANVLREARRLLGLVRGDILSRSEDGDLGELLYRRPAGHGCGGE